MERIFLPQANFLKQIEKKPAKKEDEVEVVSNEFSNKTVTNVMKKTEKPAKRQKAKTKSKTKATRVRRIFKRKKAEE